MCYNKFKLCIYFVQMVYCNEECMKKSYIEDAHNLECKFINYIPRIPGNPMINLLVVNWFFKAISQMGLDGYCWIVHDFLKTKLDPLTRGFNKNGQYISDEFLTGYSLYYDENNISLKLSFLYSCIATNILHCVIKRGMTIPTHQILTVGASFLHMIKLLYSNSVNFRTSWPRSCSPPKILARGLYPVMCLFNHSCDANVTSYVLDKKTAVLKATHPISKGSQVTIIHLTFIKIILILIILFSYKLCFNILVVHILWFAFSKSWQTMERLKFQE